MGLTVMMDNQWVENAQPTEGSSLLRTNSETSHGCGKNSSTCHSSIKLLHVAIGISSVLAVALLVLTIRPWEETNEINHALRQLNDLTTTLGAEIPDECESSLLITRHCDDLGGGTQRDDGTKHCSRVGTERSYYLASLFGSRWPYPTDLYALAKGQNERQFETLQPLSKQSGIPVQIFDDPGAVEELQEYHFEKLATGEMCGQLAVATWKHKFIRRLSLALGCGPDNGCPDEWDDLDFDLVMDITFVYRTHHLANYTDDSHDGWHVYGTTTHEYFDPVAYENRKNNARKWR